LDSNFTYTSVRRVRLPLLVTVLFFLSHHKLPAQIDNNYPFKVGERVKYTAYYNWKFVWLSAGTAEFNVSDTIFNGISAFHFISTGSSYSSYDWFFKVRERFESVASKSSLSPLWFMRKSYEGGYEAYNNYIFNYSDSLLTIESYNSDRPFNRKTYKINKRIYDVLTAIYYCRSIEFKGLRIGEKVPLNMAIDDGVYNLFIRYLGTDNITHRDGRVFDCYKFSVKLVEGTIFKGGEDMVVWVTRDKKKLPVVVEAKILIGSVKAYLLDYKQ
jgi:hypothetical protein